MKEIFKKIFSSRIHLGYLAISVIGFIVGLSLVLLSSEVYLKVNAVLGKSEQGNYLILNKEVSFLSNTLLGGKSGFSQEDVEDLQKQPFINKAASITSSSFKARVMSERIGFKTDMFFESVPESYIDVDPSKWQWSPSSDFVPIVIPREFLHLYNFGFATSQGTRQISPSILKSLTANIRISKPGGGYEYYKGKIVALSDRLPTILVPHSFNEYANEKYGDAERNKQVTRVIADVKNPSDPDLRRYLDRKGIEADREKLNTEKTANIVKVIVLVILAFGGIFILLSVASVLLSIALMIAESKNEVRLLLQLGYTRGMISRYFLKNLSILLAVEVVITTIIFYVINNMMNEQITEFGYELPQPISVYTIALGVTLLAVNVLVYYINLKGMLKKYS